LILGIVFGVLIFIVGLEMRLHALPPTAVPQSAESMEQEALALQDKGEYKAAEGLFRKCLAERQRALGADNIDTLAAMNNLANLLHGRGENSEAETLHLQVLEARERILGPDHPHTLASLNNLALVLNARGNFAGAEPYALAPGNRCAGQRGRKS
jgi:tetratricopeptide (TPR) repeat protein